MLVRAQLRWIVVGAAVSGILALPYLLVRYVVEIGDSTGEAVAAVAQVGSCALPLAAAFAISKYRLFDVDAMIGRTLVYLPLMGILSGLYTASIALFQRIFIALTGETSDLAIVLTILLIASAFTPVRRALEGAVERRFPARPTAAVAVAPAPAVAEVAEAAASRSVKPLGRTATILSVGDGGVVPCPRGPSSVVECLSCPHLLATVPGEAPAVVCDIRPATA